MTLKTQGQFKSMEHQDGLRIGGRDTATCLRQVRLLVEDLVASQRRPIHDIVLSFGVVLHDIATEYPYAEELAALGKQMARVSRAHSRDESLQGMLTQLVSGAMQEQTPPGTGGSVN